MLTSLKKCWRHWNHVVHRARDTVTVLQIETPEFSPPEMWPPNSPDFWIWWTAASGVSIKRGSTVRGSMKLMRRSWKNVCWGNGGCWTTPSSQQQRLHSGVVVWMHVFAWMVDILNINFEPLTICCVLFVSLILVPLNVIAINMCGITKTAAINSFGDQCGI